MEMDDLQQELTDYRCITEELSKLIDEDQAHALSLLERHQDGESFAEDEDAARAIITRVQKLRGQPERQLILIALSVESMAHAIPRLLAANNQRLLRRVQELLPR